MINRHKHFFIFQCFKQMFSIDEPHYWTIVGFLLPPNRRHASVSFLVTLKFTLFRSLITLSSKSLLLTDSVIDCRIPYNFFSNWVFNSCLFIANLSVQVLCSSSSNRGMLCKQSYNNDAIKQTCNKINIFNVFFFQF